MLQIIIEAIIVGIVVVIIGVIISSLIGIIWKKSVPKVCQDWNKNHVMEIALFLTGFLTHILFQVVGINKKYCSIGYACKK